MELELATGNFLRPNGLGGYLIRQSDLSSWDRCQLQKHYYDEAANNPDAPQPMALSATVYGTVMHYALMVLEKLHHEGRDDALQVATATFEQYWHPDNITLIAERVDEWLPRQTYGGLRDRGIRALRDYYNLLKNDDGWLLGLEYQFAVPLPIRGVIHTLTGTIDRLAIRKHVSKPYLAIEDFKTGKQPTYLRYNIQGTSYAYATTQKTFWTGWPESGMGDLEAFDEETLAKLERSFERWGYALHDDQFYDGDTDLVSASRRFRWINIQDLKVSDGGWRVPADYNRLRLAVDGYIRANEAEVYTVNTTGEICRYCPFRARACGGGLPSEKVGAP